MLKASIMSRIFFSDFLLFCSYCKGTKFLSHWEILKKLFLQKSTLQQKKVFVVTRLNAEKCFINFFRVPPAVIVLSSLSTFSGMSSTISGK